MEKFLTDILKNIDFELISGNLDIKVNKITDNSRNCSQNTVFVAIKGFKTDGHNFVDDAVKNGASVVVVQKEIKNFSGVTVLKVPDTQEVFARMSANFFDNPSKDLKVIGITGTNGKTTTATVLYRLMRSLGYKAGLISTVEYLIDGKKFDASHTTPAAFDLQNLFFLMKKSGVQYVFMEVSSHALDQKRTFCTDFDGAVFTNITQDHLDYHKDFKNYLKAKKLLFDNLKKNAFALVNADDKNARFMLQNTKAKVYTFALKSNADFKAKVLEKRFDGTYALIDNNQVWFKFVGTFNIYNLLAAYSVAVLLGFDKAEILKYMSAIEPVRGRFDTIKAKGINAIVDYAHTPDALENILKELNTIKKTNQKIITVVGAGGNRDKSKRPKMAAIALFYSDLLILTSDNPRFENPEDILDDMMKGIDNDQNKKVLRITDRKEAIKTAIMLASEGDLVLVAGKGHETYQEINGVRKHFDDKEILQQLLKN